MALTPDKTLDSKTVFDGQILKVRVDEIEAADGHRGRREIVETRGAVAVVCVHEGSVILVRQYRHAVGETLSEIPAGIVDPGEDAASAAARELVEEVGLRPKRLEHLVTYYVSPGFTNHRLDLYFADDVELAEANPDPGEIVELERVPVSSVRALLESGEIRDAKTLVGLSLYAMRR